MLRFFDDPGRCFDCGAAITAAKSVRAWDMADSGPLCIPCILAGHGGQVPDPGRCCYGVFEDLIPPQDDLPELAVLHSSAAFWREVWNSRRDNPPAPDPFYADQPLRPETATAARLAAVARLLTWGEWPAAALALEPVASRWLQADQPTEERLWCWQPRNTARIAGLWAELERQIFATFPPCIQQAALERDYQPPRIARGWTG